MRLWATLISGRVKALRGFFSCGLILGPTWTYLFKRKAFRLNSLALHQILVSYYAKNTLKVFGGWWVGVERDLSVKLPKLKNEIFKSCVQILGNLNFNWLLSSTRLELRTKVLGPPCGHFWFWRPCTVAGCERAPWLGHTIYKQF